MTSEQLKAIAPTWAKFTVTERYGLDGLRIVFFEHEPFRCPFSGKYISDSGKVETIDLTANTNQLLEL